MEQKKQVEVISVKDKELIGSGVTSRVYRLSSQFVVKVFLDDYCLERQIKECHNCKMAKRAGIPTAEAIDLVKTDEGPGMILQYIDGKTMAEEIGTDVWKAREYARKTVQHLEEIRKLEVQDIKEDGYELSDYMASLIRCVEEAYSEILDSEKKELIDLIKQIPNNRGYSLGDFHPGNVILSKNGFVDIDLAYFNLGGTILDIVSICIFCKFRYELYGEEKTQKYTKMSQAAAEAFWKEFLDKYCSSELEKNKLESFCLVLSGIRNISTQKSKETRKKEKQIIFYNLDRYMRLVNKPTR